MGSVNLSFSVLIDGKTYGEKSQNFKNSTAYGKLISRTSHMKKSDEIYLSRILLVDCGCT
jgi:hypothetical protein